jgi:hypothetical protein
MICDQTVQDKIKQLKIFMIPVAPIKLVKLNDYRAKQE